MVSHLMLCKQQETQLQCLTSSSGWPHECMLTRPSTKPPARMIAASVASGMSATVPRAVGVRPLPSAASLSHGSRRTRGDHGARACRQWPQGWRRGVSATSLCGQRDAWHSPMVRCPDARARIETWDWGADVGASRKAYSAAPRQLLHPPYHPPVCLKTRGRHLEPTRPEGAVAEGLPAHR